MPYGGQWTPGWQIHIANLDGDTSEDVFVYSAESGEWYKCFNRGSGNFVYAGGKWAGGWTVKIGDLNGDGQDDVFVYSPNTGDWYSCLNGAGNQFTYRTGKWSPGWTLTIGDLNGDERADLFVYSSTDGVLVPLPERRRRRVRLPVRSVSSEPPCRHELEGVGTRFSRLHFCNTGL